MEKKNKFLRLNRLYHYIFGEKFYKKINFEWHKYPARDEIIQETINRKNYKSYLEIGCDQDLLFSKIKIEKKIGVDPNSGGTIRDTSDNFFKKNNSKFDIIFIDGLHEYAQVKKDINNSLFFLNVSLFIYSDWFIYSEWFIVYLLLCEIFLKFKFLVFKIQSISPPSISIFKKTLLKS